MQADTAEDGVGVASSATERPRAPRGMNCGQGRCGVVSRPERVDWRGAATATWRRTAIRRFPPSGAVPAPLRSEPARVDRPPERVAAAHRTAAAGHRAITPELSVPPLLFRHQVNAAHGGQRAGVHGPGQRGRRFGDRHGAAGRYGHRHPGSPLGGESPTGSPAWPSSRSSS